MEPHKTQKFYIYQRVMTPDGAATIRAVMAGYPQEKLKYAVLYDSPEIISWDLSYREYKTGSYYTEDQLTAIEQ